MDKALSERLEKLNVVLSSELVGVEGMRVTCNKSLSARYLNGQTFGKYLITLRKVIVSDTGSAI